MSYWYLTFPVFMALIQDLIESHSSWLRVILIFDYNNEPLAAKGKCYVCWNWNSDPELYKVINSRHKDRSWNFRANISYRESPINKQASAYISTRRTSHTHCVLEQRKQKLLHSNCSNEPNCKHKGRINWILGRTSSIDVYKVPFPSAVICDTFSMTSLCILR